MKTSTVAIVFAVLVALIGGGILLNIIMFPVNTANKMIETAYDAQDKVINADNAIYNYEWFKQQKQDIEGAKKQLLNAEANYQVYVGSLGDRSTWTFEDKTEVARLNSVAFGLNNHYTGLVADYNARASMATRNIFADHVLPSYIDALTFIRQ